MENNASTNIRLDNASKYGLGLIKAVLYYSASLDTFKLLEKYGANINIKDEQSTIHVAIDKNRKDIVKYLCKNKNYINIKNSDNITPLQYQKTNLYSILFQLLKIIVQKLLII